MSTSIMESSEFFFRMVRRGYSGNNLSVEKFVKSVENI